MSKTTGIMALAVCAAGFVAGSAPGCGGSSSTNVVDLCNKGCDKEAACMPDAGALITAQCKPACMSNTMSTTTCTNSSAIISAYNACLAMDCAGFSACLQNLPACQGGGGGTNGGGGTTGSAGTNGGGGTTGSGGSSGAACSVCDKAAPCCAQLFAAVDGGAAICSAYSTATCNAATGATQTALASACMSVITSGAGMGLSACQ